MLWMWSCPVSTKELFLKIAVLKRQKKSLKSTFEVVSFISFASCTSRTIPIMHPFSSCIFMLHFDLEKIKSCKYVATELLRAEAEI